MRSKPRSIRLSQGHDRNPRGYASAHDTEEVISAVIDTNVKQLWSLADRLRSKTSIRGAHLSRWGQPRTPYLPVPRPTSSRASPVVNARRYTVARESA